MRRTEAGTTMDILGTIFWLFAKVLGTLWSIVWFLISGWVSTLLQILVLVAVVYVLKYGWRRAPIEISLALSRVGRFAWGWVRTRDRSIAASSGATREVIREVRVKEWGDVNLSTLMSISALVGLLALGLAR